MALLTRKQTELKVQREIEKQQNLKKKREIQEKKELYGENWKQIIQTNIVKDMESEIGADIAPHIYDFVDVYDYFNPIFLYKSAEGKTLKMDYDNYIESEEKFKQELENIDLKIEEQNKSDGIKKEQVKEESQEETKPEENKPSLENDGAEDPEVVDKTKSLPEIIEEKKQSTPEFKVKLYGNISKFFSRFTPLYNKHICSCCGQPKDIKDFYPVYNIAYANRIDTRGTTHMYICKECTQKLFYYLYTEVADKNVEMAMQYVCTYLNLYWDVDLFVKSQKSFEDSGRKGTLIGEYIKTINRDAPGMLLMDSPFLKDGYEKCVVGGVVDSTPYDWSKEDYQNKKLVLSMCGYDPFESEEENDRKMLYRDLLSILTDGMENDYIKLQAGINIVQSFFKIRKMTEKQTKMEKENAPLGEQKALSDLKAKELAAVSTYARDNGMSEKYANAKAKGELTLTGMMRKMDDKKYEDNIVNKYDVQTAACIEQAAEASFKAIMGQLSLSDAEVWKLTQEQYGELTRLRRENSKLEEEVRRVKYQLAEIRLQEKIKPEKEEGDE